MTILRQRMIEDLRIRNYSDRTIQIYVDRVAKFAQYFGRSPHLLGPAEIRQYQIFLVKKKKSSWAQFNQTVCALRFFYRVCLNKEWTIEHIPFPKQEKKLPLILSRQEIDRFFEVIGNLKHRTIFMTIYATGLRISEALHLHLEDIDRARMLVRVHQGKEATRIATFPCRQLSWRSYAPTGKAIDRAAGSSRGRMCSDLWRSVRSKESASELLKRPV